MANKAIFNKEEAAVKPVYKCPMCRCEENTKKALESHLVAFHDTFHMEQEFGIKRD